MSNWMRRRIERSRARCEKTATNRPEREQAAGKQTQPAVAPPPASNVKGN